MRSFYIPNGKTLKPVSPEKIKDTICYALNIDKDKISEPGRKGDTSMARHIYAHCLWVFTNLHQDVIAGIIGRDRTTISYSLKKIRTDCKNYPEFRNMIIQIEEAIDGN